MGYSTAYARWVGVGPYYAMFPVQFVEEVIQTYTWPGQRVLDPFAGRATSIFVGAHYGRPAIGIEINPIGWIYGKTKLDPAPIEELKMRLAEVVSLAKDTPYSKEDLPEFFHLCFSENSLRFLLTARNTLDWRDNKIDRTLMTLILIDLHGGRSRSFSNQMRQSKAMSPDYSIRWWRQHNLEPPEINPQEFLEKKINWRYAKGLPTVIESDVLLGDSSCLIQQIMHQTITRQQKPFTLLLTSPPYIGITDYHRDQWLRLWMLGGKALAARSSDKYKRDFSSPSTYKELLQTVFLQAAEVMAKDAVVYVRTDAREQTFELTRSALKLAFPAKHERIVDKPYLKHTQTALYGDRSSKSGEKDIILTGS